MHLCVYVHVPFCLRKCAYCDFLSVPFDGALSESYTGALLREINSGGEGGSLKTVYIGGGTPTALGHGQLEKIFGALHERFKISPDTEVTVEANPGTVDGEKALRLTELGVNRISIGVQSFSDSELATLGRMHTSAQAVEAVTAARDALEGGNVSLDLIYGIPGQTLEGWRRSLLRAVELGPAHVSAYELTPEHGTPLYEALGSGKLGMPDADVIADMFYLAAETLGGAGFGHYEISNHALPGLECRHNVNYWLRGDYLGLGAGAHSFTGGRRSRNTGDIGNYIKALSEGLSPVVEEREPSREEALREHVFLGLRTREGLDVRRFKGEFGLDLLPAAREMLEGGLMEAGGGRLVLTLRGTLLSNRVIVRLLEGLGL
jgi:oxygen-independent coproporphyrinogen-3 oxidase